MKKIIALLSIAVCFALSSASAQSGGGQQMTPEQRVAMMKERYKGLGLNDVQVDSVMNIQTDMRTKMTGLRELPEAERPAKMKELTEERNKRIQKALPADLATKVIDNINQQRPGGGRPAGGK